MKPEDILKQLREVRDDFAKGYDRLALLIGELMKGEQKPDENQP